MDTGAAMSRSLEEQLSSMRSGFVPRANSPEARDRAEFDKRIRLGIELAKAELNPEGKGSSVSTEPKQPDLTSTGIRGDYSHYHKPCPYEYVDVYRVLELFGVTDPCLQHAIKKLLVAGGRGAKPAPKDIAEAIVTLTRWQQMRQEEERAANGDK
jgi:hypothetical protein